MRKISAALFGPVVAALAYGAAAQEPGPQPPAPIDLYTAGNYEAAIEAGIAEGDGEGLSIAARGALAIANLAETPCLECLKRVEALARDTLAADPYRYEAYVYLAVSFGYQARIVGLMRAYFGHYPEHAKEALDTALVLVPDDPWTLAALGAWHIEVIRSGGRVLGSAIYGGDFETGVALFKQALAMGPDNLVIRFHFALSLSSFDLDEHRDAVQALLMEAAVMQPRTAYERVVTRRANRLLELHADGDDDAFLEQVRRYQGYP